MKNYIFMCIFIVVTVIPGFSKYGGAFLEIGVGPRAIAMGNAYTAMYNDGFMFYWNPAALATLENMNIVAQHAKLFNGLEQHNVIGFTRPVFGGSYFSLHWIRVSVPNIPNFQSDGLNYTWSYRDREAQGGAIEDLLDNERLLTDPALGYSDFNNDAYYISFSKMNFFNIDFGWQYFVLPVEMPIGVNFKIIKKSLFDLNASGIGMDFGWLFKFGLNDLFDKAYLGKVALGTTLKDVWQTKITWDNDTRHRDIIQRTFAMGMSYWQPIEKMNSSLAVSYDFQYKYEGTQHLGLEYLYGRTLGVRFGLNDGRFSFGAGVNVWVLNVDYAYIGHDLGNSHRVGLNIGL